MTRITNSLAKQFTIAIAQCVEWWTAETYHLIQGRSFAKQVVGAEPVKTAESTIKIIEFHIIANICSSFFPNFLLCFPHTPDTMEPNEVRI